MDRNIADANAYQLSRGLYTELVLAEYYSGIRFRHETVIHLKITIDMSEEWHDAQLSLEVCW